MPEEPPRELPEPPAARRGRRILGMSVLTFWLLVALFVGVATWATVCAVAVGKMYP